MNPIAPLVAGSERSVLKLPVANPLIEGANAINRLRGGNGVRVTHADAGIRVDLGNSVTFNDISFGGCPLPDTYTLNESHTYYTSGIHSDDRDNTLVWPAVANGSHPEYTWNPAVTDSYKIAATEVFKLSDYFPYRVFQDDGIIDFSQNPAQPYPVLYERPGRIIQNRYPQTGKIKGGTFKLGIFASIVWTGQTTFDYTSTFTLPAYGVDWNISNTAFDVLIAGVDSVINVGGITTEIIEPWAGGRQFYLNYTDGLTHGWNAQNQNELLIAFATSGGSSIQSSLADDSGVSNSCGSRFRNGSRGKRFEFYTNLRWRDHPSGSLTIGPYAVKMIVFAATDLWADDELFFSKTSPSVERQITGGFYTLSGSPFRYVKSIYDPGYLAANTPFSILNAGTTMRVRCMEIGGAYCWASGYIGVKPFSCCPIKWQVMGLP